MYDVFLRTLSHLLKNVFDYYNATLTTTSKLVELPVGHMMSIRVSLVTGVNCVCHSMRGLCVKQSVSDVAMHSPTVLLSSRSRWRLRGAADDAACQ